MRRLPKHKEPLDNVIEQQKRELSSIQSINVSSFTVSPNQDSISALTHLPTHTDHMSDPIPEIQAAYNKKKGQPQIRT